jgi:hypothetical protein
MALRLLTGNQKLVRASQDWFSRKQGSAIFRRSATEGENRSLRNQPDLRSFLVTDLRALTPSGPSRSMSWR